MESLTSASHPNAMVSERSSTNCVASDIRAASLPPASVLVSYTADRLVDFS